MTRYVDTNVLVRLMTNDVPELAHQAIEQIDEYGYGELVILDAVLAELFFVLEFDPLYGFSRRDTVLIFEGLLSISQFQVSELALSAFELFSDHEKLDFADCLLAVAGGLQKSAVMTFDKDLLKVLS